MVRYEAYAKIQVPVEKAGIEAWNKFKEALEAEGIVVDQFTLQPIKENK